MDLIFCRRDRKSVQLMMGSSLNKIFVLPFYDHGAYDIFPRLKMSPQENNFIENVDKSILFWGTSKKFRLNFSMMTKDVLSIYLVVPWYLLSKWVYSQVTHSSFPAWFISTIWNNIYTNFMSVVNCMNSFLRYSTIRQHHQCKQYNNDDNNSNKNNYNK